MPLIQFYIPKQKLAKHYDEGKDAADNLISHGYKVKYHQLDIENIDSITAFAAYIKTNYGGIDVLVNNAGIMIQVSQSYFILY